MAKGKGGFIGQDGLNAPDAPTGVSGAAGDKQVTVSFTSPSDVGGSAITGYNVTGSNGADLGLPGVNGLSYQYKQFSFSSQDNEPRQITFKTDGSIMYLAGGQNTTIYQYTLSTAWDVSTATYASKSFSVSTQASFPRGVQFKSDGTKMFVASGGNKTVYQYSLSTAWDVSTASYDSVSDTLTEVNSLQNIVFKTDGTKMYANSYDGSGNEVLYQYGLSTAWDLSTSSYDSKSLTLGADEVYATFTSDGTKLYTGNFSEELVEYTLSTAWDISTGSATGGTGYIGELTSLTGITLKSDDNVLFATGQDSDKVVQYSLTEYPTASPVTITGLTNGTSYTFNVWAINAFGLSPASDASDSVSPKAALGLAATGSTDNGSSTVYAATVDVINIATTGNATSFGSMTQGRRYAAACSSETRGLVAGGNNGSRVNTIDYLTIATTGGGTDFGDLTATRDELGGLANATRGLFCGGYGPSSETNQIQYVTIASTGNASDFGDMAQTGRPRANMASPTRGIIAGFNNINNIEYVTIASLGNSTDFGDQTQVAYYPAGGSNSTRGLIAGGTDPGINVIQYITIASTGNAADFGDLTQARHKFSGQPSTVRCVWMGGATNASVNTIDYATIASLGNAADFGDLPLKRESYGAGSITSAHGGLQ